MSEETNRPRSTADLAYGDSNGQDAPAREEEETTTSRRETESERSPLLTPDMSSSYSGRWQEVQATFVDEPQAAVREADALVAEVIQALATTFADQRQGLEEQWSKGSEVSTEDLRQALMQYRSFFHRLLAT